MTRKTFLKPGTGHQPANKTLALQAVSGFFDAPAIDHRTVDIAAWGKCHVAAFTGPRGAMISSTKHENTEYGGQSWHERKYIILFRDLLNGSCRIYVAKTKKLLDNRDMNRHSIKWETVESLAEHVKTEKYSKLRSCMADAVRHLNPAEAPVVYARIGYMLFYRGVTSIDGGPTGGGSYNEENIGHEVTNFSVIDDRVYGYFQIPNSRKAHLRDRKLKLERILPGFKGKALHGVTVLFFAPDPEGTGQVMVGWYRNATVHRHYQPGPQGRYFLVEASESDTVLLTPLDRKLLFTRDSDTPIPGRSDVFYPYDQAEGWRRTRWMSRARKYVESYEGDNVLRTPEAVLVEILEEMEDSAKFGQGFANSAVRRLIEDRAMNVAKAHYRKKGYTVTDKSGNHSYDLLCTKRGSTLKVEVKGTRSEGGKIFLTKNEVALAEKESARMELFILHSITLSGKKKKTASGGTSKIIKPWKPKRQNLTALAFEYEVD